MAVHHFAIPLLKGSAGEAPRSSYPVFSWDPERPPSQQVTSYKFSRVIAGNTRHHVVLVKLDSSTWLCSGIPWFRVKSQEWCTVIQKE